MTDTFQTLLCDHPEAHVLRVTLNRPDAANAMNTQMGQDLLALFSQLLLDPGATRVVVLTGAGARAFCAGGDLRQRDGMTDQAWRLQPMIFEQTFHAIMECPVPVVAAVNGAAYGGGCEMALHCDFIHASEGARFALTETGLGIIPGGGGTQNLPRAVGARRARELIFAASLFTAAEAAAWGMVNRVWPAEGLMPGVLALARAMAANSPLALRQAKRAIAIGSETDLRTGLAIEIEAYNRTVTAPDRLEGVRAFNEKRPPRFAD